MYLIYKKGRIKKVSYGVKRDMLLKLIDIAAKELHKFENNTKQQENHEAATNGKTDRELAKALDYYNLLIKYAKRNNIYCNREALLKKILYPVNWID